MRQMGHDAEPLPSDGLKTISAMSAKLEAVPPFLLVTVRLKTPITDKDEVETLIEATISVDVLRKGKTVIPNGSLVKGSNSRLERTRTAGTTNSSWRWSSRKWR